MSRPDYCPIGNQPCQSLCTDKCGSRPAPVQVPEGMVLVPVEPTPEMLEAAAPFPEHLRDSRDEQWAAQMQAATLADQMAVRRHYINMLAARPGARCWCATCRPVNPFIPGDNRMVLCPDCGNKRCPKASDHRYQCSGSNEPGQVGVIAARPGVE